MWGETLRQISVLPAAISHLAAETNGDCRHTSPSLPERYTVSLRQDSPGR